jgi:hypothetical protein
MRAGIITSEPPLRPLQKPFLRRGEGFFAMNRDPGRKELP